MTFVNKESQALVINSMAFYYTLQVREPNIHELKFKWVNHILANMKIPFKTKIGQNVKPVYVHGIRS